MRSDEYWQVLACPVEDQRQKLLVHVPAESVEKVSLDITCLSKCRIGDVFKHFFLLFLYLFRMNEQGGGQMTCFWYVLISLIFLSIFCF